VPALWETAAALCLPVFPCNADKKPTCPHGFKEACRSRADIRALFGRYPGELIGVPTGTESGFDVLDLDTYKHETARHFARSIGAQATRGHQTKQGGLHYLFQHHNGLRNSTGYPVPGVDIRAEGGYIIWWAAHGYAVNPLPIEPWPPRLLHRFMRNQTKSAMQKHTEPLDSKKLAGILRRLKTAVNGERNNILHWAACRLGDAINAGDIGRNESERILIAAGQHVGLDYRSIIATIASGFNRTIN
jgi:bifunctional DNA primase/polymerase-like protein